MKKIFILLIPILLCSVSWADAGNNHIATQSLAGKHFQFFPWSISPDTQNYCLCIASQLSMTVLNFGENGEFTITDNYVTDCQEGLIFRWMN